MRDRFFSFSFFLFKIFRFIAAGNMAVVESSNERTLLLRDSVTISSSGGWRSALFIIGAEGVERFAYYGMSSNLITYLTGQLGQSVAAAAESVNIWTGTTMMFTLVGAFVADSFMGRYRTIVLSSAIYILGLGLLTLSAWLSQNHNKSSSSATPKHQVIFFFFSLYLIAIGQGGHKPCITAFGADQFDSQDPEESKAKSSFFNWWFFGLCSGSFITLWVVTYIQDNLSWTLGFGIPCIAMVISFLVFILGTKTYRSSSLKYGKSPFVRIGRVFVAAIKNWRTSSSIITMEEGNERDLTYLNADQFKFLNKACFARNDLHEESDIVCSISEVEEAKSILRLVPIWITVFVFSIVCAQVSTFFTKQAATIDRSIISGLMIPVASLQSLIALSVIIYIPIYDLVFIPISRIFTRLQSGITKLQRIGTGMVISVVAMVVAALVEMKRLKSAQEHGLIDMPDITIPMSIWWLVPQFTLLGLADVFTTVGLQEFFYDEVPKDLKSMALALYNSVFGVGNFLSSFLISLIDKATKVDGQHGWFPNNLNKAHLDYFYLLLAGLSVLGFVAFLYASKSHIYSRGNTN